MVISLIANGATLMLVSLALTAEAYVTHRSAAWQAVVLVLAGIAAIGVTALLTHRLLASASRPLSELAALMERVSSNEDFSVRAAVRVHDEVGALATSFNRMLRCIQDREQALEHVLRERKRVERRHATLAHYDTLTGLPNRTFFNAHLATLLTCAERSDQQVALLFLDLDNFKLVNDTLGHDLGDSLLETVAARLRRCVRATDSICRFGGDEFAIVLDDLSSADYAAQIAEKVFAALSQPFVLGNSEVYVTCSMGIGMYPQDGRDVPTLIGSSETAMYHAKERGKGNFQFFSANMNARAVKRLSLDTRMRQALEKAEFLLHYQPQVELSTGEIVGAEALLRWNQPGVGIVGPDEFIQVAEDTGLIVPIGEWVLWAACSQARLWQRPEEAVRVSVNVSARQLAEPNFVDTVANVLLETQLDPSLLELELTERALMADVDAAIAQVQKLRSIGVLLAIDDFGTGYSSMSYLKRFPISEVKIDRSFISDIPGNTDNVAITKAIVAMAHGLDVDVVAEGVETKAQMEFLSDLSCDRVQGHYIARAISAEEFQDRLMQRRQDPYRIPVLS